MAYTKTQLIRMAFQQLGTSYNIPDVDTDNSQNGVYARDAWDAILPKVFTKFFWNFAKQRVQLSIATGVEVPRPWAYLYQIPTDKASITTIWPRGAYTIWGQYLACNINPVWIDIQVMTLPSAWDNTFSMYVMWCLAEFMAPVATQDDATTKNVQSGKSKAEADAQIYVSQTQTAIAIMSSPYISCRYNYPYGNGGPANQ